MGVQLIIIIIIIIIIFVKLKNPAKLLSPCLIAGVTISNTPCPRHITLPFGSSTYGPHDSGLSNPTSFPRPALPMTLITDDIRQRRMKHPPLEPSNILKRCFITCHSMKCYSMEKVSKLSKKHFCSMAVTYAQEQYKTLKSIMMNEKRVNCLNVTVIRQLICWKQECC